MCNKLFEYFKPPKPPLLLYAAVAPLVDQLILELGVVKGSIKLFGCRGSHGWRFRTSILDQTAMLLNEEDRGDLPLESKHESEWVNSWEAALSLLDKYHWHIFYPMVVHPEFRQQVWAAVQERFERDKSGGGATHTIEAWRKLWGRPP